MEEEIEKEMDRALLEEDPERRKNLAYLKSWGVTIRSTIRRRRWRKKKKA